jgi:hypothetical protein
MKKHIKWLFNEIDLWIGKGIITADQGAVLKGRYPAPGESLAWGRIIFFSIGAVLIGLGVILLFAYNWQRLHKFAKLAVIFAALIIAHGAGFWLKRAAGRYQTAGEGLHLLGTMIYMRTAPVDPRDIFRGDYVRLNYDISRLAADQLEDAGVRRLQFCPADRFGHHHPGARAEKNR